MTPPALAQALLAAAAPANDYEVVAGDLHEEYLRILRLSGTRTANRWYWTQTLLSIPPLLSYSRSNKAVMRRVTVPLICLAVLVAMLLVLTAIQMVVQTRLGGVERFPDSVWVCINYTDAAVFGAILAWMVRTDGLRIAFFASLFLVLCFVIPALAGHPGSQAPFAAWIILCGAIPAMCIGAGLYQAIRRRKDSVN